MLGRRKLSDTEFVESQRKYLRASKWLAWFSLAALVPSCVLIAMLSRAIAIIAENLPVDARGYAYLGLVIGLTFGLLFAWAMAQAAGLMIQGFDLFGRNRGIRLLVTYHDALQNLAASMSAEGNDPGDGVPAGPSAETSK